MKPSRRKWDKEQRGRRMTKTIKQIADELGVSKTAVRKKIENLGLRSSLRLNGNQFAIDEEQESLIKSAFFEDKTETKTETSSRTKTETVSVLVSMLQKELDSKNEQLQEKDRQIREKDKQIAEMQVQLSVNQKLIDQEQQLRMVTEKKFQLIEQQQEQEEPDTSEEKKWWQFWK